MMKNGKKKVEGLSMHALSSVVCVAIEALLGGTCK